MSKLETSILNRARQLDTDLRHCVKVDRENKQLAWKYWKEFSEKELWRPLKFESLTDYAENALGKDYQWIWRQKTAAEIAESHPEVKDVATAVAVKKIPLPQRRQVVSAALEQSQGELTPKAIKNAVASQMEPKKTIKLQQDATGCDIPPEIQPFWNRNEEVQFLLSMISKVRTTLEKAAESRDKLFCKIDIQMTVSRLKMVYEEIDSAKSFAVCPDCNGLIDDSCQLCRGRGTLSKFHWGMVDENIKKLRES